jgi:putative oxidoreductase
MINTIHCILDKGRPLISPLLAIRLVVAWFFYQSALTKVTQILPWPEISSTTYALFEGYYNVPLLDPELAAVMGTWAEIVLPILLLIGLMTRFTAGALFVFNLVALISLPDAGLGAYISHLVVYNILILTLIFCGPGRVSVDHIILDKP